MAITLVSSGTIASTTAQVLLVPLPDGIQADDIGIWHTQINKSTLAHLYQSGWTIPDGTVLNELVSTRTLGVSWAYRRFDGSTSGNVTVSHVGPSTAVMVSNITLWRGVSTAAAAPHTTSASTTANSSIYNTEGVTAEDTDKYLVILASNTDDAAAMVVMSSGSRVSTSLALGYSTETALGNGAIISMFHGQVTSSGTVLGGTCRMGTIEAWSAFEVLLTASTVAPAGYWTPTTFSLLGVQ